MASIPEGLSAVLHWERVIAVESSRLRISWFALAGIALFVLFSGYIPSDGTALGRVRVTLRLVEVVVTFTAVLLVLVLGAYFFPYEEMQNRRILISGVLPAERWAILAGTALGIFRVAALFFAAGLGMLALKFYLTEDVALLRHVAGRKSYSASFAMFDGKRYEKGTVSLAPGHEMEIHYTRWAPEVGAALRVTPYAGSRHSLKMAIGLAGDEDVWKKGARAVMGQASECLVVPGSGEEVVLKVRNLADSRVSIPLSEASIVEETLPLWNNMLRALALRWIMLLYLTLVVVGVSSFLGMVPTLIVGTGVVAGGYMAPFVSALFKLPRFSEGYAEVAPSWNLVRVVGKAFGDLVHTSPGESLPLGELIEFTRVGSALWLLVNGGIVFAIGCYALSRRELAE